MHTARQISLVLASFLLAFAAFTSVALADGPATVTVRVEGPNETLLPATVVTTNAGPVVKDENPAHSCAGTSAAGGLQLATNGDWDGAWFGALGYSVETIKGLSYPFTQPYFWEFWLDNKPATGFCAIELNTGDSLLFFPECFSEKEGVCPPSPSPLGVEAPRTVQVNEPFTVVVNKYDSSGNATPVSGAILTGGTSPATSDATGHATVEFGGPGNFVLHATAPDTIRSEVPICVHDGNDASCGTVAPATSVANVQAPPSTPTGPSGIAARVTSVIDGRTYPRRRSPRLLAGEVFSQGSSVASISLRLRRTDRGQCWAYDGVRERFVRVKCRRGRFFRVASGGGSFSYLLPSALARGRYVLDIHATDGFGDRTALARGTTRIVFYVR